MYEDGHIIMTQKFAKNSLYMLGLHYFPWNSHLQTIA